VKIFKCTACHSCICTIKAGKDWTGSPFPNKPPEGCVWGTGYPCDWKLLPNGGRKILGKKR
jgi:hypothetical protein